MIVTTIITVNIQIMLVKLCNCVSIRLTGTDGVHYTHMASNLASVSLLLQMSS